MTELSDGGYNVSKCIQNLAAAVFLSVILPGYNCLENEQKIQVWGLEAPKWLPQCVEISQAIMPDICVRRQ